MTRELNRRIALLERIQNEEGIEYVVLDYAPDDDEQEPYQQRPVMSDAEWAAIYCVGL